MNATADESIRPICRNPPTLGLARGPDAKQFHGVAATHTVSAEELMLNRKSKKSFPLATFAPRCLICANNVEFVASPSALTPRQRFWVASALKQR